MSLETAAAANFLSHLPETPEQRAARHSMTDASGRHIWPDAVAGSTSPRLPNPPRSVRGMRPRRFEIDEVQDFGLNTLIGEAVEKTMAAEAQKLADVAEQVKQLGVGVTAQWVNTGMRQEGDKWFFGSELKLVIDESVPPGEVHLIARGHAGFTE